MEIDSVEASKLGSAAFRREYGVKYSYVAGAMYKGIASEDLVAAMGQAGLLGFLGTGGMPLPRIEACIEGLRRRLRDGQPFGMNLLATPEHPEREEHLVDLYLRSGVRNVEAAAYVSVTPALVRLRLRGLRKGPDGRLIPAQRIMAKVSRPEVAEVFMRPAPPALVAALVDRGQLTREEGALAAHLPMANEICVEADSGGHTDRGVAYVLMPSITALRDELARQLAYDSEIRIGAAGGIGTPEAAAAAFILGADFILTGSINQCTVEAGTSDAVKDQLQEINVQDTTFAPAGDMFELGAKVQVLRKGLLFPSRANKLYELYQRYESLDEIDDRTRRQIQDKFFRRSFEEVWAETEAHYQAANPQVLERAARSPKLKMSLIFRWYFVHSTRLAMAGSADQRTDYQVHCGPALGAFNQWVKGTELASWRARRCADLGERLMRGAAALLSRRLEQLTHATGR